MCDNASFPIQTLYTKGESRGIFALWHCDESSTLPVIAFIGQAVDATAQICHPIPLVHYMEKKM